MTDPEVACKTVNQAARHGLLCQMKDLIAKGHPVDAKDNRGWRPIHEAAADNHVDCLKELLENEKTDASWGSHEGCSPLYLAAEQGHYEAVIVLLNAGADPDQADLMQNSPLIAATRSGRAELVRLLVDGGAAVNCQQYTGSSPLHLAAAEGRDDMVRIFLDAGARLDIYEDYHISPVFSASQYGQVKCLELLLEHAKRKGQNEMASTPAEDGGTPLYLAAQEGHIRCLKVLLRYGADANALTNDPIALPLHAALEFGHYQCADVLLPVTNHSLFRYCEISPWSLAMTHTDPACLRSLLDGGVDVNYCHRMTEDDHLEPRILAFCDHRVRYSRKVSALVALTIYHCPGRNAEILLKAGAHVFPRGRQVPPLLTALNERDLDYAKILISYGAPVNDYHPHCIGNLTLITSMFHWKGLELLLKVGADPTHNFSVQTPENWSVICRRRSEDEELREFKPSSDSDAGSDDDDAREVMDVDGENTSPISLFDILRTARVVSKRAPTTGMVLYQMLQYVANVTLDPRIEGMVESRGDWLTLRKFTESPRSLTHLCRLTIRGSLGPKRLLYSSNLRSLPLPEVVVNYLLYRELDPEEPPRSS